MAVLDYERLDAVAQELRPKFGSAKPFPHVVVDDLLPPDAAEAVHAEFAETQDGWNHYHHYNERKLALQDYEQMRPHTRALFEELNGERFVRFIERLTGIRELISDPDLDGAGMHLIRPGGYLNVHTDFLSHTKNRHWSRQINLLLYFNKDWKEEWNGNLELWDADMTHCVQSILPAFNRCVIFHTREKSFHGHPHKLACPPNEARKSIALYYFRDEGKTQDLTPTNYRALPGDPFYKKWLVAADRGLLRFYSFAKRYTKVSDETVNRFLRRF